eukprot:5862203-Amphidinium_carterae.1
MSVLPMQIGWFSRVIFDVQALRETPNHNMDLALHLKKQHLQAGLRDNWGCSHQRVPCEQQGIIPIRLRNTVTLGLNKLYVSFCALMWTNTVTAHADTKPTSSRVRRIGGKLE